MKNPRFKVKIHGRAGIEYEENGKKMLIDSEMLTGPEFDLVIFTDSIRNWEAPHDNEHVSQSTRTRIIENIETSLKKLSIDWA